MTGIQGTHHELIIGNAERMMEIDDESIHLTITSPPYFNAPFDYKDLYESYGEYKQVLSNVINEVYRVLVPGRVFVLNIDDMLVQGQKYPIVADATKMAIDAGFRYRDRIIWKKPEGYLRISRRSGVLLQNPYPMYFYPDNLLEHILIFQKGKHVYKSIPTRIKEASRIDKTLFQSEKWYMTLWEMTNVLPGAKLEKGIAAFPETLPKRFIILFSHVGETVLDPFCGSGTTMKVARQLQRNSIGMEINDELIPIIKMKTGFDGQTRLIQDEATFRLSIRGNQD